MSGLILTVTNAGRAALVNLPNTGTNAVLMASVGVSATSFTPTPATTALPGEIKRISTIAGEAVANDTIHVTVRDESSAVYTVRSFGLYLSDGTLFAVYSQANPIMEKSAQAMLLLAIDVAFADISAAQITFGDTSFINPPATTERQGVVELATDAEATTGTDATRAVTPKGLKAAVTSWLDTRFGNGAPSAFIKGLLTSASAAALRTSLAIKSAALKDEGPGNGLNADLLDGQHGSYYTDVVARLGYRPWGAGNDGAGSGLDADLLDGLHASAFALTSHSHDYLPTTSLGSYAAYAVDRVRNGYYGLMLGTDTASPVVMFHTDGVGGIYAQGAGAGWRLYFDGVDWHVGAISGRKVWHAANDGGGSGLDADLLDGLHAHQLMRADQTAETFGIYRVAAISDLNEVPRGDYRALIPFHAGFQAANRPGGNYFGGIDMSGGLSGYRWQLGAAIPATTFQLWGRQQAAGTWQEWVQFWHTGNDGSGSGLDADLLDGLHGSSYLGPTEDSEHDFAAYKASIARGGYHGVLFGTGKTHVTAMFSPVQAGGFYVRDGDGAGNSRWLLYTNGADWFVGSNHTSKVWHAANDGAGSGLDADLFDGAQSSSFVGPSTTAESAYAAHIARNARSGYYGILHGADKTGVVSMFNASGLGGLYCEQYGGGGARWLLFYDGTDFHIGNLSGRKVWNAANDGAGSGLDADLLDGQQGSYYLPAASYSAADVKAKLLTVDGSGSGVDADLLDGLHASDFQRVTSQNMAALNGYRVFADGTKECWTSLTIAQHSNATWTLPVAHTEFVHPSFAISTANGITDVQDNTGITSINGAPPVSITFWNADNRTITIWVRTIGR
ncbi:MAG TPA: hypothetical protein VIG90_00400 [Pedomonas sp.]|uniref:hypothetical protein n=1 Tax=Pedomonas sp. TaxID=2976421 RepID=UPI002F424770